MKLDNHKSLYPFYPSEHLNEYLNLSDGIVTKCEVAFCNNRDSSSNKVLYDAYASHTKKGTDYKIIIQRSEAAKEMLSIMNEEHATWSSRLASIYDRKISLVTLLIAFVALGTGDGLLTNHLIPRNGAFIILCIFIALVLASVYYNLKEHRFEEYCIAYRELIRNAMACFSIMIEASSVKMLQKQHEYSSLPGGNDVEQSKAPLPLDNISPKNSSVQKNNQPRKRRHK